MPADFLQFGALGLHAIFLFWFLQFLSKQERRREAREIAAETNRSTRENVFNDAISKLADRISQGTLSDLEQNSGLREHISETGRITRQVIANVLNVVQSNILFELRADKVTVANASDDLQRSINIEEVDKKHNDSI